MSATYIADIVDDYDDQIAEARADTLHLLRYQRRLSAHPNCMDPDHPGCEDCQEDEDDE